MNLSFVIPCHNEKESLPLLIEEIIQVCSKLKIKGGQKKLTFEIIVIDDGSTDGTRKWFEETKPAHVVFFQNASRRGKSCALNHGFKLAKGKLIFTMDGDLQDDPKEIPQFLKKLDEGYDLVSGWKKKRFDSFGKTFPSKIFNLVVSLISGVKLHDFNCGFKLYRRQVVEQLYLYGDFHRFIPVMAHWNGVKIAECVVRHRKRKYGTSKYGWLRLFHGFFDLITMLFLNRYNMRPLHVFGMVGFLLMSLGGGIVAYFIILWIIEQQLHLRPLMIGGFVCILLGVQIFSLGLIGEMIVYRGINITNKNKS